MRRTRLLGMGSVAISLLLLAAAAVLAAPADTPLQVRLEKALLGKRYANQIGAVALDLRTGRTIYEHKADRLLIPASNAKLWTTAAALDSLGPEYEFTTRLEGRGAVRDGTWAGDLKVIGGGDPSIAARFADGDATVVLRGWAQHLKARGVRRVTGDLILDDTFFDRKTSLPSWPKDDPSKAYLAPVGALSLNENCVELLIAPGEEGVRITSNPATSFLKIQNVCTLTAEKGQHLIVVTRREEGNVFRVSGRIWKGAGVNRFSFAIYDPSLYFGTVLREVLAQEGIILSGEVRRVGKGDGIGEWVGLDSHRSALTQSVEMANRRSQNFHAEQIFKTLGGMKKSQGTFAAGSSVVEAFLQRIGLKKGSYHVTDGSGLSRENLISARGVAAILRRTALGPDGEFFTSSLAVSGDQIGTLRRRLRSDKTKGRVRAKTGSLRAVSCLSGFVTTPRNEIVVFSILMNEVRSTGAARQAQDAFCTVLVDYASD